MVGNLLQFLTIDIRFETCTKTLGVRSTALTKELIKKSESLQILWVSRNFK